MANGRKVATQRRCAIYTRKSTEEGLEQDFNSLDAQREACEAFIRSQCHEGWRVIDTCYDDGGFSGGSTDRPALQQLLADIEAKAVDVVVVYKIDRLTRSLFDFAKIVDVFDAHGVSFVSVTQQFNTTTSMGRLTLNVLLSFAQFEREVTGERIRDKFSASRRKGMWMGGHPSLGYDIKDRRLVINEGEADTVRMIFRRFTELGSVYKLKRELDRQGVTSKKRISTTGRAWGGRPISAGSLYQMLQNPTYIGKAVHKGKVHEGEHDPIVDESLWNDVQAKIKANRKGRRNGGNAKDPSLLAGLVFDADGERLTPSHSVKNGRRYRYYVSRSLIAGTADDTRSGGWRIPANEIETVVTARLCHILKDQAGLIDLLELSSDPIQSIESVVATARENAEALEKGPILSRHALVRDIVQRIIVSDESVRLMICLSALGQRLDLRSDRRQEEDIETIDVPIRLTRRGVEMKLVLTGLDASQRSEPAPTLIKAIARGHIWFEQLKRGEVPSIKSIAIREGVADRYVSRLINLAFLAPDIVEAILDGRQPRDLSLDRLTLRTDVPFEWSAQRTRLGF